jgi:hypothetical protein
VEMILRICGDRPFAERQRGMVVLAAQRLGANELAHRYTEFLSQLVAGKPRSGIASPSFSANGHTTDRSAAMRKLSKLQPWPEQRPDDAAPGEEAGWLGAGSEVMLAQSLSAKTKLVIELGAWLGLSTRYIADAAPNATVVSVDHWKGSAEHQEQDRYRKLLSGSGTGVATVLDGKMPGAPSHATSPIAIIWPPLRNRQKLGLDANGLRAIGTRNDNSE